MPCPCWPYLATGVENVENVEMEFEKCWTSICQTSCHLIEALLLSCCIVNLVSQFQSHAMFAILAENKRMLSNVATCGVMRDSLCLDFNSSESPLRKTPHPAEADDRNSLKKFSQSSQSSHSKGRKVMKHVETKSADRGNSVTLTLLRSSLKPSTSSKS